MRLDPAAAAAGFRLFAHETLTSTNVEALALGRRGESGPFWVTARAQTAGRGRRGRRWVSERGNLYATLLLNDPASPENASTLSFVAGLAVHDAIARCAEPPRGPLALKWPNDILCNGKKLAGILIEGEGHAALTVAVGIGVNCVSHPEETSYPATDLAAEGVNVAPEELFHVLSGAMLQRLAQWRGGAGFTAVRADWLDRAFGIGSELLVRLPGREYRGRCETLDERGRLVLRLPDGSLQTITAGDVFPVGANEPAVRSGQTGRVH